MSNRHTSSGEKLMQAALKQRVKDLEAEVTELKTKLDQLRKAKSTTIVKRQREVIYVGEELRRQAVETNKQTENGALFEVCDSSSSDEDDEDFPGFEDGQSPGEVNPSEKNQNVTTKTDEEPTPAVSASGCSEEKEPIPQTDKKEATVQKEQEDSIRTLFRKISNLNDENMALTMENKELVCRVAQLTSELSINEAKSCEREEKIKAEISAEWRKKYDSWIEEMEKKLAEINQNRQQNT